MPRAKEHKKYQQAATLFQQGKYAPALALLDHLHRSLPKKDRHVIYARARCLAELGRKEEALQLCKELRSRFKDQRGKKLADRLQAKKDRPSKVRPARRRKGKSSRAQELPSPEPALTKRFRWAILLSISVVLSFVSIAFLMIFNDTEIFTANRTGIRLSSVKPPLPKTVETKPKDTPAKTVSTPVASKTKKTKEKTVSTITKGSLNKIGRLHLRGGEPNTKKKERYWVQDTRPSSEWIEEYSRISPLDEVLSGLSQLRMARFPEQETLVISRRFDEFERLDPTVREYGFLPYTRPIEEDFLDGLSKEAKRIETRVSVSLAKKDSARKDQPEFHEDASEKELGLLMEPLEPHGEKTSSEMRADYR